MTATTEAAEYPRHELDTPFGRVLVTVQGAHAIYVGAGDEDEPPMISINGVQYVLRLRLRRSSFGWFEASGGWDRALYRPGTYDNRPTEGAKKRAHEVLMPLIERMEREMPGLVAAGQRAYLLTELARVRESHRLQMEHLAEYQRDIDTLLRELGEPEETYVPPVPPAVVAAMDRAWRATLAHPMGVVCKHWCALNLVQEMERLGVAPPATIIDAIVNCDDQTALDWRRPEEEG